MGKQPTKQEKKAVETLTHEDASCKSIPTAKFQSVIRKEEQSPIRVAYERRSRDLDPLLVWRGKDEQDWSDLVTHAPPLYIQEKVHPEALIDDLLRRGKADKKGRRGSNRSVRRFQRTAGHLRQDEVLSARRQLDQTDDSRQ
jgi:adenine-specific DNA-methyltransferase